MRIEITIPVNAQLTEIITEHKVTALKLLNTLIADRAGNITSAETNKEPTRFIARTIITATITAMKKLHALTLIPEARAKSSSNVTAKILC